MASLPPRKIAAKEGIPVATVKTRLQRGQAQLRDGLEGEFGANWSLALAPLLVDVGGGSAWAWPGWELQRAAALGVLVTGSAWVVGSLVLSGGELQPATRPQRVEGALAEEAKRLEDGSSVALESPALGTGERGSTSTDEPARLGSADSSLPAVSAAAVLMDIDGQPLPGLRLRRPGPHQVRWQGGDPLCISNDENTLRISLEDQERFGSDPSGWAALCDAQTHPREWRAVLMGESLPEREFLSDPSGRLVEEEQPWLCDVVESGWTLAWAGRKDAELQLIAAPSLQLRGVVVDPDGQVIQGAQVRLRLPEPGPTFDEELRRVEPPTCTSDPIGRFVIREGAELAGSRLIVTADGYECYDEEAPLRGSSDLTITLEPLGPQAPRISGTVMNPLGEPLTQAEVRCGSLHVGVEVDGSYELLLEGLDPEAQLLVWAPGYLPHREPALAESLAQRPDGRLQRFVVLEPCEARVAGVIVDSAGRPRPGVRIGLLDPTPLDHTLSSLEARIDRRAITVESDDEGCFSLGGLLHDQVRLRLFDPRAEAMEVTDLITAGDTNLRLRAPLDRGRRITGRIILGEAARAAGERVERISCGFDWLRIQDGGALFENGPAVQPDADGAFVLNRVSGEAGWLRVQVGKRNLRFPTLDLDLTRPLELRIP